MSAPAVALGIVSWNTAAHLDRCLASLAADAGAGRVEVWVVDNASADGSVEVARRHGFANVLALEENLGFARALDLVAARTDAPWVGCANADVAVTEGALERLLAAGEARERAGAVAPRLLLEDGSVQDSAHDIPSLAALAAVHAGLARRSDPSRPRFVDWAVGAFLLVRREALDEAGGFGDDARLYAEDLDLGWRLKRAGWRTWYEPSAVVHHDESAATRLAWGNRRHALRMAATYGWLVRRRGAAHAIAFAVVCAAGHGARSLIALLRRDPAWKGHAGEARMHLGACRRGLREPRGHGA